jgi:hypothetical protein
MNYKYAETLGNKKRNTFLAGLLVALLALAGCSLVVAGLVDYGVGKLEQIAVETVVNYVAPPPGTGTYKPGPSLYEQLHKEWKEKLVSTLEHDAWDERVALLRVLVKLEIYNVNLDTVIYLRKWNV